mmetsp:Transcript_113252/g.231794  ORF Transcript_113252/g.231794 Transcript_113252/m.231794 type:complete len:123 (+) Transcript_113252:55-423(+)
MKAFFSYQAKVNPENKNSVAILNELQDTGIVQIRFSEDPPVDFSNEKIILSVRKKGLGTTTFAKYRDLESKKSIKQKLGALALDALISEGTSTDKDSGSKKINWYDLTFKEIRSRVAGQAGR